MTQDVNEARKAQRKLSEQLAGVAGVNGIGLSPHGGHLCVKVFLTVAGARASVPDEIDGVHVETEVIGGVEAL